MLLAQLVQLDWSTPLSLELSKSTLHNADSSLMRNTTRLERDASRIVNAALLIRIWRNRALVKVPHNTRRGFKGVLMVDTALGEQHTVDAQMRKSQLKYKESSTAAASTEAVFMAVEWSKPYKYGYLNLQVRITTD